MRETPLSIHLDSDTVVLRSVGEEEPEPAVITGSVVLDLHERADIKDVHLAFTGSAKITYIDTSGSYKSHTSETPLYFDDHSFLPSFTGSGTSNSHHHSSQTTYGAGTHGSSSGTSTPGGEHSSHGPSHSLFAGGTNSNSSSHSDLASMQHHASAHNKHSSSSHGHGHGHGHHSHMFNPGMHTFPFAMKVPGSLPASLRTHTGSSSITYQLKASCHKATALSSVFHTGGGKWSVKRAVTIVRGLTPEAVEFNQTLEIENTWPGKIMYNITLPHKAFCAGEKIPVALKFTPIAKGVRVTQLVTSVREHLTVATKTGQPHNTQRDVVTKKHNFVPRSASSPSTALSRPASHGSGTGAATSGAHVVSVPPSRTGSHSDLASLAVQANRLNLEDHPFTASGSNSHASSSPSAVAGPSSRGRQSLGEPSGTSTPASRGGLTSTSNSGPSSRVGSRANSPERVYYGRSVHDPDFAGNVDEDGSEDVDVDAVVEIPLPAGMTPSHTIEPLMVSHKIKWSAYIRNLDGHTSELRCALPIHILSPQLAEEAALATTGTRTLLFGPSGVLVPAAEGIQQVDLPSYSEHILDRVANIDGAAATTHTSMAPSSLGLTVQTPGSGPSSAPNTSTGFMRSPWASPLMSPEDQTHHPREGYFVQPDQTPRPINWADSELLNTLAMSMPAPAHQPATTPGGAVGTHDSSQSSSRHTSPTNSRPSSRPNSRPGSRQNSRPSSRASSPVRGESTNAHATSHAPAHDAHHPSAPPALTSRSSSGFFKPLRALSSLAPHHHGHGHAGHAATTNSTPANTRSNTLVDDHHNHPHGKASHSTGNIANFFHVRPSGSRRGSSHNLPAPEHHALGSSSLGHGDVAQQTIAALEAHQREVEAGGKGKGRASNLHSSHGHKGKKKATFAVHDDEDDADHSHDHHHHDGDDSAHHSHSGSGAHTPAIQEGDDDRSGLRYLSQVPSYDIASRGFLGGGLPPLSINKGLPSYVESEHLSRPGTPGAHNHSFGNLQQQALAASGGSMVPADVAGGGVSPARLAEAIEQQRRQDEADGQGRQRAGSAHSGNSVGN